MDVSVESLKLRRMRVHNEISFSAEVGMTAEDLAALREELRNLDRKINEKINEMSTLDCPFEGTKILTTSRPGEVAL